MKEKFIRFMKFNRAWKKYQRAYNLNQPFIKAFKDSEAICFITSALVFVTDPGVDYWYKLNLKWKRLLLKEGNK